MFSIGSNSYNIKQSIVSNVPGIENEDEYKYSYARVLFDETEGKNFDIAANKEVFVEDVLKYIYGEVPTQAGAYNAIIATGYSTVVLDKPLTEHDVKLAEKRYDDPDYVFSKEELSKCADTDGDGLLDFEEVMFFTNKLGNSQLIKFEDNEIKLPSVNKIIAELDEIAYVQSGLFKARIQYKDFYDEFLSFSVLPVISDPTSEDSDNDGIMDCNDNDLDKKGYYIDTHDTAPLSKGLEGGITGELTIISCSNLPVGHGFLMYRSFVNDTFNLGQLTGGYLFDEWDLIDTSSQLNYPYYMKPYDYISLGNAGTDATSGPSAGQADIFESITEINDGDLAGIYFNREFAYDYLHRSVNSKSAYSENASFTRKITHRNMESVIEFSRRGNFYNLRFNNCIQMAIRTWKHIFPDDVIVETVYPPTGKFLISGFDGSRRFDILSEVLDNYEERKKK